MSNPELLIERMQEVLDAANKELKQYLGGKIFDIMANESREQYAMHVDYVTLFTTSEEQNQKLNSEAASIGTEFYQKNGVMYDLSDADAPTKIVRICDPKPDSTHVGGVDFAFGAEAFPKARDAIIGTTPYYEIKSKTARGHEEGAESSSYTYIKTVNPDSPVAVTCLSTSFVDIVR